MNFVNLLLMIGLYLSFFIGPVILYYEIVIHKQRLLKGEGRERGRVIKSEIWADVVYGCTINIDKFIKINVFFFLFFLNRLRIGEMILMRILMMTTTKKVRFYFNMILRLLFLI